MMLEAVWFKDGKEVYCVSPVLNIVCDDDMSDISEIEVSDGTAWYSYDDAKDVEDGADNFVLRIKRD